MKRRSFIKTTSKLGVSTFIIPIRPWNSTKTKTGEVLYNGIILPQNWPPRNIRSDSFEPMPVPYLKNPPEVIPIDVGRQLFVDDFLIEETTLLRRFHKARKIQSNPVIQPETQLEKGNDGQPVASPKDGGVWWDPKDNLFKMWYEAGWLTAMAYAESKDGINWIRPKLDIGTGTNQILPGLRPDSTTVFIDHDTNNQDERFKMFLRGPNTHGKNGFCMTSSDGIHWLNRRPTDGCGDRSTIFYNPFRKKWIYSLRNNGELGKSSIGRSRFYHEHSDFLKGGSWDKKAVFWTGADHLDIPDPSIGDRPQLYNLSAVGYESLMLGMHQIHLGPDNRDCAITGIPKTTELMLSYSRDGFHWHRPDREAFIPAARQAGVWDRGYVQSVGGICNVVGDELRFYYIGFRGDPSKTSTEEGESGMYANGSTGVAVLRRDGFVSLGSDDIPGSLTTKKVTFNGKYLFVNVDCPNGELKVEILDEHHRKLQGYTLEDCSFVKVDSTIQMIQWKQEKDLARLRGEKIRFRFVLENGELYSFWVSPDKTGASYGYVGAGGPGFDGSRDLVGLKGYKKAENFIQFLKA